MRHKSKGRKFGRRSGPRDALRRGVVCSLFRYGRITTTLPRAKEFRGWAERMITIARRGAAARSAKDSVRALNAYKRLFTELHDEPIVAKLIEEIAPAMKDRPGGYTRIVRFPGGRKGDNATEAIFELVTYVPPEPRGEAGEAAAAEAPAGKAAASK